MQVLLVGAVDPAVDRALAAAGHQPVRAAAEAPGLSDHLRPAEALVFAAAGMAPDRSVLAILAALEASGPRRLVALTRQALALEAPDGSVTAAGLAQAELQAAPLDWTILRLAPRFGPEDGLTGRWASAARRLPLLPLAADGGEPLAPLSAADAAEIVTRVLADPLTVGGIYDLVGPERLTAGELLERILAAARLRRAVAVLPAGLARRMTAVWEACPWLARSPAPPPVPADNAAPALLGRALRPCLGAELGYLATGPTRPAARRVRRSSGT